MIEQHDLDQDHWDKINESEEIASKYKVIREKEEKYELLESKGFFREAMENISLAPDQLQEEIEDEWRKVSVDRYHEKTSELLEWYALWQAETVVAREIERMSVMEMKAYLYKHVEINDVVTLVRCG